MEKYFRVGTKLAANLISTLTLLKVTWHSLTSGKTLLEFCTGLLHFPLSLRAKDFGENRLIGGGGEREREQRIWRARTFYIKWCSSAANSLPDSSCQSDLEEEVLMGI